MAIYQVFQCSVCRRIKNVLQDNIHAVPTQCTITKGCSGSLYVVGDTTMLQTTPPVAGLTNWYPRGQKPVVTPAVVPVPPLSLSTSTGGDLTLAVYAPAPASGATVNLQQLITENIAYADYLFTVTSLTPKNHYGNTVISGRDSNGRNLLFSTETIAAGLVFVLVNGVQVLPGASANQYVLTANTITFNYGLAAGAVVNVSVYSQPTTIPRTLTFVPNTSFSPSVGPGSWGNVQFIEEYDDSTGALKPNKWWLYTCTNIAEFATASDLLLVSITLGASPTPIDLTTARFLLSSQPHENVDRYLNFYVDPVVLSEGYALSSATASITEIYAADTAVVELYPPFQLISSSFITADVITQVATVPTDPTLTRLAGTKIIGPV
jgi:hypothetical protein